MHKVQQHSVVPLIPHNAPGTNLHAITFSSGIFCVISGIAQHNNITT